MKETLKILMLEDNAADAALIQRLLIKTLPPCVCEVVATREAYIEALDQFEPDVILSDNTLPSFDASEALSLFQERMQLIPFILVTGTVSEEFAASIIKAGADDYLLKDRLTRLPAAIIGAIDKKQAARDNRAATDDIRFKAHLLRSVGQAVIATNLEGIVLYWNHMATQLYGWSENETLGEALWDLLAMDTAISVKQQMQAAMEASSNWSGELTVRCKDGRLLPVYVSKSPLLNQDGQLSGCIQVSYDMTPHKKAAADLLAMEKKLAAQQLQAQRKISRAILEAQEKERNFLGQELHDNINQMLASAKMFMALAARKNPEVQAAMDYPMELLNNSIEAIRDLTYRKVTPVKNANLHQLLHKLVENIQLTAGLQIILQYDADELCIPEDLKLNLYRIVQEQMSNIVRHAQARQVNIGLQRQQDKLYLRIVDDGNGFDTNLKSGGIGITNISNRVAAYGGEMQLISSEGAGCTLKLCVPVSSDT